jgi:hypothetical protein
MSQKLRKGPTLKGLRGVLLHRNGCDPHFVVIAALPALMRNTLSATSLRLYPSSTEFVHSSDQLKQEKCSEANFELEANEM